MASQDRPPPPRRRPTPPPQPQPGRLTFDLKKIDFDPKRIKLPQIAVIGFLIGIFFHACVVFAILDDGSGGNKPSPSGGNVVREEVTVPVATATPTRAADRTDCNAIRADPTYRSETERTWFLQNCVPR